MKNRFGFLYRLFRVSFAAAAALILMQSGWAAAGITALLAWHILRKPLPYFTALLFAFGLLLRLCIILILHPPVISDFELLLQSARSFLAGDYWYLDTEYFGLWGYQSGFLAWDVFWLWLWDNPFSLKLANAVFGAAAACLLYRLNREWVDERSAQLAAILLVASPFCSTLTTLLSNQIPSAFFLALGVWIFFSRDCGRLGFWRFPAAGFALQLGNILRTEGIILLAAVFAWAVFQCVRERRQMKRLVAGLAVMLSVYGCIHAAADTLVRASGLHPYGLQNGDPMWKVLTGLNFDSRGGYSSEDWNALIAQLDEKNQMCEKSYTLQNRLIRERLSAGPGKLALHLRNKIKMQWVEDGLHWMFEHLQEFRPGLVAFVREYDRGIFFLTFGLAGYGLFGDRKRWQGRPVSAYFPYFVFIAAFCAFLIVESQPRYVYLPQMYLSLCASMGIERLERRLGLLPQEELRTEGM